jgi:Secretion system C-terminal sorting domain
MKKICTFAAVLVLTFLFAGINNAQSLFNEDFSYTAGTAISGQGGWTTHSGTASQILVTTPGLTYTGLAGSGVGNAISVNASTNSEDVNHQFTAVTSGDVYASAMINIHTTTTSGEYFMSLGTATTLFYARVWIKAVTGGYNLGITHGSSTAPVYGTTLLSYDVTQLLVFKYSYVGTAGTDDIAYVWVNPTLGASAPGPEATSTDVSTDATTITGVYIRETSGTGTQGKYDGIKVGLTWNDIGVGSTPVELTSFTAVPSKGAVNLLWNTATEVNNMGFNVERSANKTDWTNLAFVQGNQTSTKTHNYSYVDKSASQSGKYYYRLKQVDNDGTFKYSSIAEVGVNSPSVFSLNQNYPNPFNPSTMISYSLPQATNVKLIVYNAIGQPVRVLENGFKSAGTYNVSFNASELSSGIYFCKIEAGQFSQIRKMMLLK